MPTDQQKSRPKPKKFFFVNALPVSNWEKSQVRQFVRTHVGKWTWQQIKDRSPAFGRKDIDTSSAHREPSSSISLITHSTTAVICNTGLADVVERCPKHKITRRSSRRPSQNRSPRSVKEIDSVLLDPFQTYPSVGLPRTLVNKCMQHLISAALPALIPVSTTGQNPTVLSWVHLSLEYPPLFQCLILVALFNYSARLLAEGRAELFTRQIKRAMLTCETKCLKSVNEALGDPSQRLSDALLLAILGLAACQSDPTPNDTAPKLPFQPPLGRLQDVDLYARNPNLVHNNGLTKLVVMKGLENVKLPGLAGIISSTSVQVSTMMLCQPTFPFISLRGGRKTLQEAFGLDLELLRPEIHRLCRMGLTEDVSEIMLIMRSYTSILAQRHDGSLNKQDLTVICDQRALLQHRLLSLPSAYKFGVGFLLSHPIYEACRLAALIYGVGVIFPLPSHTAPFPTLATSLQIELSNLDWMSLISADSISLFVWIMVMSSISATSLPERVWFVHELYRVALHFGITCWGDLKQMLASHLWLDCACDCAGLNLWNDVQSLCSSELPV